MKKIVYILTAAQFILLSAVSQAQAIGFGPYGSFGLGSSTFGKIDVFQNDQYGMPFSFPEKFSAGGGFMIDTNCSRDKLFNYRFTFGAERLFSKRFVPSDETRISMINTFGLGVARNRFVRFWIGPQIGIHMNKDKLRSNMLETGYYLYYYSQVSSEYTYFGGSLGLAAGINLNFVSGITFAIDVAARYQISYGIEHIQAMIADMYLFYPMSMNSWASSSSLYASVTIAVLYRVNDSFTVGKNADAGK
ncbi:MAG: hypothetical protein JW807_14420 [Spirochaetes bacterium]|nr:hypothetical protein [Spirochaetota bacterium]